MKINDAVFFTDNKTVRLECIDKNYYLTDDNKIYDMHPINVMAKEIEKNLAKQVKDAAKSGKYKNSTEVKKWL